ncbi:T9SS type A sorting domain-containing protein [Taibaiella soli]|uniref:Secretion system C-terminal sorting domain-containing protein n=1 Tax=Taibaiella soli TaxID=1649169 RepID=A0A2W2BBY5_9BACT|nr:T9SS type A sorting domain-containing protein [Taibaiella soli]PZF71176.1 hypothetical protein DN068_19565 [Taibaiella soli]
MIIKTTWRRMLLLFSGSIMSLQVSAQLSGTKNIPGDYPDLGTAITALNTQGVGSGGVIINVVSGNPQTAPGTGYALGSTALNSSVSAAKTIVINGNGNTITAGTGVGTSDAIFSILGTDYVTINGLNLSENAANTTTTTRMEWGYNLVKLNATAPYDGCQYNTITNCTITLNAANLVSCGIRMAHSNAASGVILPVTGAVAGDANSYNVFSGNNISNIDTAMSFRGMNAPGFYDYNNVIGGATAAAGNLMKVGGSTNNRTAGLYVQFDSVLTVQYNQFSVSNTQTPSIAELAMMSLGTGRGNMTIKNNTYDLSWAPSAAFASGNMYAVFNNNLIGSAFPTTGHSDINAKFVFVNNTITGTDTSATAGNFYGLYNNYTDFNIDSICNNNFTNIIWSSMTKTNSNSTIKCIYESGSNTSAGSRKYTVIQNNQFTNLNKLGVAGGSGELTGIDNATNQAPTGSLIFTRNLMQNCYSNSQLKCFYTGSGIFSTNADPNGFIVTYMYNKVDKCVSMYSFVTTSTGGAFYGHLAMYGAKGSVMAFDTVTNCRNNNAFFISVDKSFNGDLHDCYVGKDTTANGFLYGIKIDGGNNSNSVYNNLITGLAATGTGAATSGAIYGIAGTAGLGTCNLYNNTISDYSAPNWAWPSIYGIYLVGTINYTSYYNIYHNTVRLNPTSTGSYFGVAGIYLGDKLMGMDIRNNIVYLDCMPNGFGMVGAIVKQSGNVGGPAPVYMANTSGNNIYYVPAAGSCYYYAEGFNSAAINAYGPLNDPNFNNSCLSLYKAWMGQKERTSFTEYNTVAVTGHPGMYAPSGMSYASSSSSPITNPAITTDEIGGVRATISDIGAILFHGANKDYFPPVISYSALPSTSVCANIAPTLTANIYDGTGVNTTTAAPRMYYRKTSEADAFGTTNTAAFNGWKYVTGTNTSGSVFNFTPDYSLLTAPVAGNDTIVYFVVAQDTAAPANAGTNMVAFASGYCLTSVNIGSAAAPTSNTVAKNYYRILAPVSPALTPASAVVCGSPVMITAAGASTVPTTAKLGTDSTFNLNNDNNAPLSAYQYNHRQQMMFTAAELTAQGMTPGVQISAVSLNVALNFGVTGFDSLNIGMGNTTATSFSNANWQPIQKVFKGQVSVANGLNTYLLNTPFTWDGTSNLVVDFICRNSSTVWNVSTFNTAQSSNLNMYYIDGGPLAAPMLYDSIISRSSYLTANVTANNMRPNVQLVFGAPKPISWNPVTGLYKDAALTIPMTAADTNHVVYANPTVATNYTVVSVLSSCNSAPSAPSVITPIVGAAQITPNGAVSACDSVNLHAHNAVNLTYQWQKNGANISGATDSAYNVTANGVYRVYVVAGPGCSDTSAVAATVTLSASPVATITSSTTKACDSLTLNANTATGLSYQWQQNGANITGATSNSYKVTASGVYRVYEYTGAGCHDTSAVVTDTINVSPTPILIVNGYILSTTIPFSAYQWNKNGQPIAGETNATYLVTTNGQYSVTVPGTTGCYGTSADTTLTPESVGSVNLNNKVTVYPNPMHDRIYVQSANNVTITLRDVVGKVITKASDTKELTFGNIADGIYLVTVTDEKGNVLLNQKLVKQ